MMRDLIAKDSSETITHQVAVITIVAPFLALLTSCYLLWNRAVSFRDLLICSGFYIVTMLGITLGFHRLYTHRSFKCVTPLKILLGVFGSMAAQGPILFWAAYHRLHHRCSDDHGDPHSPHAIGPAMKGVWHAHIGWMLSPARCSYFRLVPDLARDPHVLAVHRLYVVWIILGLLIPAMIGGILGHSWSAAAGGLFWGGLIRMFLVHHSTWSINSVCHLFGTTAFNTQDESRNNAICAVLTFGEGWHNNHHAFPASARHGLQWWQIDVVYLLITLLAGLGLVWDVCLPDALQVAQRQRVCSRGL